MKYFVNCNGLFFGFDYAERGCGLHNTLCFNRQCIHSLYDETLCQLDLNVSKIVFKNKYDGIYYFDVVPVGGACNGK
ncbi:hypothetical protein GKZ28_05365 [Clostridium chromiireducens]|uniref:Uncharacterized protein n=1 Tax=Clostridium chromiireducens TaxID=225345 RepID=A0A964W170_9CLOT|nr:hypothetical protein [Clostridium chromiireducens]MVX63126.1 hypothetical protein [Clostridium chromiireducens]